jgi:hypothetical protein
MSEELPFVDEHRVLIHAPASAVWRALVAQIPRFASSGTFARLLGASPNRAAGLPIAEGATLPGFRVAEAVPEHRLRLVGRHHFSRYQLLMTLTTQSGGTLLSAATSAAFPGPHGRVYRLFVIGSRAHRVLVVRLLRDVRRRAEESQNPVGRRGV